MTTNLTISSQHFDKRWCSEMDWKSEIKTSSRLGTFTFCVFLIMLFTEKNIVGPQHSASAWQKHFMYLVANLWDRIVICHNGKLLNHMWTKSFHINLFFYFCLKTATCQPPSELLLFLVFLWLKTMVPFLLCVHVKMTFLLCVHVKMTF